MQLCNPKYTHTQTHSLATICIHNVNENRNKTKQQNTKWVWCSSAHEVSLKSPNKINKDRKTEANGNSSMTLRFFFLFLIHCPLSTCIVLFCFFFYDCLKFATCTSCLYIVNLVSNFDNFMHIFSATLLCAGVKKVSLYCTPLCRLQWIYLCWYGNMKLWLIVACFYCVSFEWNQKTSLKRAAKSAHIYLLFKPVHNFVWFSFSLFFGYLNYSIKWNVHCLHDSDQLFSWSQLKLETIGKRKRKHKSADVHNTIFVFF